MGAAVSVTEQAQAERQDLAIAATADALLAVCALQTGHDPIAAAQRAAQAIADVVRRTAREQGVDW